MNLLNKCFSSLYTININNNINTLHPVIDVEMGMTVAKWIWLQIAGFYTLASLGRYIGRSCFEVLKKITCSTQMSMKIILLINVKMPTIVGILTFISRINTTSVSFKISKPLFFTFYKQLKFHAQLSWAWNNSITSRLESLLFERKFSASIQSKATIGPPANAIQKAFLW